MRFNNNRFISSDNSKSNKKDFKSKKHLILKHIFIFLRLVLVFIDENIEYKTHNIKLLAWHEFLQLKDTIIMAININQA